MEKSIAYKKIIEKLSPLFDTAKLKRVESDDGDIYVGELKAVKVRFEEDKKQFVLSCADASEDGVGEFSPMSSWLFPEDAGERDISSIANDFEDSCRALFGYKTNNVQKIDLPRASSNGNKNPEALAQRFLAVFPGLKEEYAEHMQLNNEFFYVEFFEDKAVPEVCKLLDTGDKKKISKFMTMLNEMYIDGTKETTALVAYTILGGVGAKDKKYKEILDSYIGEFQYLKLVMPYVYKLAEKQAAKAAK